MQQPQDGSSAALPASAQGAPPFEEEIPPFGKGHMLTEPQIRYCLAEFIRVEAVRPVLNRYRPDQVEFFNALIAAFNSRCAKYRYELPAMESAKHDVESNRARIESAAQQAFLQRFSGPPEAGGPGRGRRRAAERAASLPSRLLRRSRHAGPRAAATRADGASPGCAARRSLPAIGCGDCGRARRTNARAIADSP